MDSFGSDTTESQGVKEWIFSRLGVGFSLVYSWERNLLSCYWYKLNFCRTGALGFVCFVSDQLHISGHFCTMHRASKKCCSSYGQTWCLPLCSAEHTKGPYRIAQPSHSPDRLLLLYMNANLWLMNPTSKRNLIMKEHAHHYTVFKGGPTSVFISVYNIDYEVKSVFQGSKWPLNRREREREGKGLLTLCSSWNNVNNVSLVLIMAIMRPSGLCCCSPAEPSGVLLTANTRCQGAVTIKSPGK